MENKMPLVFRPPSQKSGVMILWNDFASFLLRRTSLRRLCERDSRCKFTELRFCWNNAEGQLVFANLV